jgi:hypothetical protein
MGFHFVASYILRPPALLKFLILFSSITMFPTLSKLKCIPKMPYIFNNYQINLF